MKLVVKYHRELIREYAIVVEQEEPVEETTTAQTTIHQCRRISCT